MSTEGNEGPPITFEEAVRMVKDEALRLITERFQNKEHLDYHNVGHTNNVIRRTSKILEAIAEAEPGVLDERRRRLGELVAAWHDTVQDYTTEIVTAGTLVGEMRKRFTAENEKASADEAAAFMTDVRRKSGNQALFSEEDIESVRQGIHVTIPDFHPEHKTVFYSNLTEESGLVARAVALADLGTAGMDGPDAFIREGAEVFREDNIDVTKAFRHPETLSAAHKEFFRNRMIEWSRGQERFAAGRKALLDGELKGLSEPAQEAVRKLFDKFDDSIAAAKERTELRKEMPFDELARDFGYEL